MSISVNEIKIDQFRFFLGGGFNDVVSDRTVDLDAAVADQRKRVKRIVLVRSGIGFLITVHLFSSPGAPSVARLLLFLLSRKGVGRGGARIKATRFNQRAIVDSNHRSDTHNVPLVRVADRSPMCVFFFSFLFSCGL